MPNSLGRGSPMARYKPKSAASVGGSQLTRVTGSYIQSYGAGSSLVSNSGNQNTKEFPISRSSPSNDAQNFAQKELISTLDISHYFFPLFYAGERGALGIWDKTIGQGHIKRRTEEPSIKKFHVLELINGQTNTGTFISAPTAEWKALHLTLPHLILISKNFKRNFSFEVLVLDSRGIRRRLSFATWYTAGNLKRYSFLCQVPLRLDAGWNEIHVDLKDLINSVYKTRYVETLRVQIYANCRLRQVFFCGDEVINQQEMVPSMKLFNNIELLNPEYGPVSHPSFYEPGPERQLHVLHNAHGRNGHGYSHVHDPLGHYPLGPTRLEKDLKMLHNSRYDRMASRRTVANPHKALGTTPSSRLPRDTSSGSVSSESKQELNSPGPDGKSQRSFEKSAGAPKANTDADNNEKDDKNNSNSIQVKIEHVKSVSIPKEMTKSMTLVEIMQRNERLRKRGELLEAIAQHQAQQAELREGLKRRTHGRKESPPPSTPKYKAPTTTPPSEERPPYFFQPKNTLPESESKSNQ